MEFSRKMDTREMIIQKPNLYMKDGILKKKILGMNILRFKNEKTIIEENVSGQTKFII